MLATCSVRCPYFIFVGLFVFQKNGFQNCLMQNVPFNGGLRLLPNIMKEYDSVATNLKNMENMEDLENSGEFEKLSKLGKTQGK